MSLLCFGRRNKTHQNRDGVPGTFLHRVKSPFLEMVSVPPRWNRTIAEQVKAAFYDPALVHLDSQNDGRGASCLFLSRH